MHGLARDDVTADDVAAFVRTGCEALGLALDAEALRRVSEMFAMNARIAAQVMAFDVPESQDPLPITRLD